MRGHKFEPQDDNIAVKGQEKPSRYLSSTPRKFTLSRGAESGIEARDQPEQGRQANEAEGRRHEIISKKTEDRTSNSPPSQSPKAPSRGSSGQGARMQQIQKGQRKAKSDAGAAVEMRNLNLNDNGDYNTHSPGTKRAAPPQNSPRPVKRNDALGATENGRRIHYDDPHDLDSSEQNSNSNHFHLHTHSQEAEPPPRTAVLTNSPARYPQTSTVNVASVPPPRTSIETPIFPPPSSPPDDQEEGDTSILRQPETRAITQDQLVSEVKGIYAGLVMVEKKCVEIDQQQSQTTNKLSTEQWQALIALHRTLLHEHHDFFLASQHPSASPALRRLATKYAMPARMWRHGIHSFLELLRHRLPDSLDHMLAFVYLAYSMMALLMESVPSFLETWIECLGDLARYRMAIEEADLRDREIWSGVARMWYNKAADKSPGVGRIQHHLAVLARPNIVQQLYYYSKALVSVVPFFNARESVMLLFTPFLEDIEMASQKHALVEVAFVKAHGVLFTKASINRYVTLMEQVVTGLDSHIARTSAKFRVQGPELVSSLIAAAMNFGEVESPLLRFLHTSLESTKAQKETSSHPVETPGPQPENPNSERPDQYPENPQYRQARMRAYWNSLDQNPPARPQKTLFLTQDPLTKDETFAGLYGSFAFACQVLGKVTAVVAQRIGDKNILPYMHVYLACLISLAHVPGALEYMECHVPWERLAVFLNTLGRSGVVDSHVEGSDFPLSLSGTGRQLPEDFVMRGLVWSPGYLPADFFEGQVVDEDERTLELPSHAAPRTERCLYIGVQLAACDRWLTYNPATKEFAATAFGVAIYGSNDAYTLS